MRCVKFEVLFLRRNIYSYDYLKKFEVNQDSSSRKFKTGHRSGTVFLMFPVDIPESKTANLWAAKCICGNYFTCNASAVMRGGTKSCGCLSTRRNSLKYKLEAIKGARINNYEIRSLPTEYKSRDIKLTCKVCNTSTEKGNLTEHLIEGRKFCKCSHVYKRTFEEVKEDCHKYLRENPLSPWRIESFPEEFTYVRDYRINLECKLCGHKVDMLFGNFVRDKGCQGCFDIRMSELKSKDLSYFLEKSFEKHGDRYDYSKAVYTKCREPLEIVCREHGSFWQSPDNHYNKGKGCKKCNGNRYVNFKRVSIDDNKDLLKSKPSGVYILKSSVNTEMYKIGISVKPEARCRDVSNESGLGFSVIKYEEFNMYDAYVLENLLHNRFDKFNCRESFQNKFAGYTECFLLKEEHLNKIDEIITDFKRGEINE